MTKNTCEACRFWDRRKKKAPVTPADEAPEPVFTSACRIRPPTKSTNGWPITREDDWCGEYLPWSEE